MQQIQELIADDQLRKAMDLLLAQTHWLPEQRADLVQISAQLAAQERSTFKSNQSADTLWVQRNQIREAMLRYDLLLAQQAVTPAVSRGSVLKKSAFYLLVVSKVLLYGLVAFHFSTGGFSQGETLMIITILSPVFIGYLISASQDHHLPLSADVQRRLPVLRLGVYGLLPVYVVVLAWVLDQTPRDQWTFETTRNWLLGIETTFGSFIVWLINHLFSEKQR